MTFFQCLWYVSQLGLDLALLASYGKFHGFKPLVPILPVLILLSFAAAVESVPGE